MITVSTICSLRLSACASLDVCCDILCRRAYITPFPLWKRRRTKLEREREREREREEGEEEGGGGEQKEKKKERGVGGWGERIKRRRQDYN